MAGNPSDNLWTVVGELNTLAHAFDIVGNVQIAAQLVRLSSLVGAAIVGYSNEMGEMTEQLVRTSWAGTDNLLRGSLLGVAVGNDDPTLLQIVRDLTASLPDRGP
jgi:hypothetical protein